MKRLVYRLVPPLYDGFTSVFVTRSLCFGLFLLVYSLLSCLFALVGFLVGSQVGSLVGALVGVWFGY